MDHLTSLWIRLTARLHGLAEDDRGVTTEHVIWIAFLAALGLTVTALFGPKILAAARDIRFE